jgi:hypothetical protein
MKKTIIIIIIAIIFMAYNIYAQESIDYRDKMQFGLKIGTNNSNVWDSEGEEFNANSKFGLVFGGFVAIPIGKNLGIQPELLFSQKGFQATGKILGGGYNITRSTNYLDVPVLFALKPSPLLTLLAGPQFSYLLKQTDVFENATSSIAQEQQFLNDNIRNNTLCFLLGLDLNYFNMVIGARVGWDLLNNNGDGTSTTPRYKNVWGQLTIGYRFFDN